MNNRSPENKTLIQNLIWFIYLPGFLFAVGTGMIAPVLPLFARNLTESFQLIGWVLAADFLGQVVSDVPAGYLMERVGRKRGMILGLIIIGVATGLIFLVTAVWQLFVLRVIAGFGVSMYSVARHAWLADGVDVSARGRAIAVIGGVFRGGKVVGPLIGGTVAVTFGQRPTFILFTLILLVPIMILVLRTDPNLAAEQKQQDEKNRKNESHLKDFGDILRNYGHIIIPAGTGAFFAQMVRSARTVILPLFAAVNLGLNEQQIGTILATSSLIDTILFPLAGYLMDRYGRKYAIVPSFVFQGIGVLFIAMSTGYWGLMFAACLIGLGNGISSGTMMTLSADLSPKESRGGFLGLWRLIGDAGFASAPLIVGAIADALTLGAATIVLAFSGGIASAIFAWFVPETLKKEPVAAD